MSKQRQIKRNIENAQADPRFKGKVTRTTSRGVTVICLPIAGALEQARLSFTMPEPPTFTVESGGPTGPKDVIRKPYTEAIVKKQGAEMPEADRQAWDAYQAELAQAEQTRALAVTRLVATEGILIPDYEDESWVAKAKWAGLSVPELPWERQWFYFITYVIGEQTDAILLMTGIYEASGIEKEVVDRLEATFRHPLEQGQPEPEAGQGAPRSE